MLSLPKQIYFFISGYNNKELELSDLTPFYRKEWLILETAQQIIKDFGFFGEDIPFPPNTENAHTELKRQLTPVVRHLFTNNHVKLLNLLYRIDVSEHSIAERSENNIDKDISVIISDLIIERELKKVIIRNYFSGKIKSPDKF